jgi:hypothetical protein
MRRTHLPAIERIAGSDEFYPSENLVDPLEYMGRAIIDAVREVGPMYAEATGGKY